jgi:hypothetical protein
MALHELLAATGGLAQDLRSAVPRPHGQGMRRMTRSPVSVSCPPLIGRAVAATGSTSASS